MRLRSWIVVASFAAALELFAPADAAAQACGGANEPPCTRQECVVHGLFGNCLISKTIRTCDTNRLNLRLTVSGFLCLPCGAEGQTNCDSGPLCSSTNLRSVAGSCVRCGDAGLIACDGGVCDTGTRNVLGICTACGSEGEIACSGGVCDTGTRNVLGICQPCGDAGEPACPSSPGFPGCFGRTNQVGIGDAAVCVACGGRFQPECTTGFACDAGLNPIANRCVVAECGGDGQLQCSDGPACEPRHEPFFENGIALCFKCGGDGDRQCSTGNACDARHEPVFENGGAFCFRCGGHGDLQCSTGDACDPRHEPLLNPAGGGGLGFCFRCGGEGEQACHALPACDRPMHNILGFCQTRDPWVAEPSCNCTVAPPPPTAPGAPIWGFADLHAHQFANLGFGGVEFVGAPYDPDGITFALPACGFTEDFPTVGPLGVLTQVVPLAGVPVHGPEHSLDLLGLAAGNAVGLSTFGVTPPLIGELPEDRSFNGWPKWSSPNHQRMYHKWLERAWRGGLRLMIVQAVNNELSCATGPKRLDPNGVTFGCNDMAAIDRQIAAVRELEAAIDEQNGGTGQGWYRVVTSPSQAREVMNSGKLAVVLGIEVDSLFDCQRGNCSPEHVEAQLQRYYDLGVRHAYPIHLFDNDFGGASYYFEAFNPGNRLVAGRFFDSYDCSSLGYEFRGAMSNAQDTLLQFFSNFFGFPLPLPSGHVADCNTRGLTALGEFLIRRMIDKRMIIDLDHLSYRAVDDALTIAEQENYPVIASHAYVAGLHEGGDKGERKWLPSQVRRLRDLGGVVAPILIPEATNTHEQNGEPVIVNNCKASSKEWVQRYLAFVEQMSGSNYLVGVGYGSDFNGMTQGLAPRFGDDACAGDAESAAQSGRMDYPFNAHGLPVEFGRQVTGGRTFDYNEDGVAHVGLIPDFIQDLKTIGLTDEQLVPFFRSAEAFLQMWERIGARDSAPLRTSAFVTPPPNDAGWHNSDASVSLFAAGNVTHVLYSTVGPGAAQTAEVPGNTASVTLAVDGQTTVSFRARDGAGNVEPERQIVVRIDQVPPVVEPVVSPNPNPAGWHKGDVLVTLQGNDPLSGIARCDGPFTLSGEGTAFAASGKCTDQAGNTSTVTEVTGIKIDRTPPNLTAVPTTTPNAHGWYNANVRVVFEAFDALSGLASTPPPEAIISGEGTGQTVEGTAIDNAGNETRASASANIDKTPPAIAGTPSRPPDSNGWYNHALTVNWLCTDGLSEVDVCTAPQTYAGPDSSAVTTTGAVTDKAGNAASGSVAFKFDATAPTIALTSPAQDAVFLLNQSVTADYSCADNLSGLGSCTGSASNNGGVDTSSVGLVTFGVNASDIAGNGASLSHRYRVRYAFEGFLQPVNLPPLVNVVAAGRSVVLKWTLKDATGTIISDPASFVSLTSTPIACDASPGSVLPDEPQVEDAAVLKFTDGQWHYHWKTAKEWTGCRLVQLTLKDGTEHVARFQFR